MNRRDSMLVLLAFAAAHRMAAAQQQRKIARIGLLSFAASPAEFPEKQTLESLGEAGFIDGKNVAIEYRFARNDPTLLAKYAADLVRLNVDVIVTFSAGAGAAKQATRTIPIIFGTSQNPTGLYVASLARPGGNLTGMTFLTDELSGKRLGLLKETMPRLARAAVMWEPAHVDNEFKGMQAAAPGLGIQLLSVEVPRPVRAEEVERGVRAAKEGRADALVLSPSGFTIGNRKRIIALAAQAGIPVVSAWRIFPDDGAIFSYGPNLQEICRRIAAYVDRVLKGARPEDLPVEGPTKFELVINMKAARALGIAVPQAVLLRADEVIQ